MQVIKRNRLKEPFSVQKAEASILKAFDSCHYVLNKGERKGITHFCKTLAEEKYPNCIKKSAEIQEDIEQFLISRKKWFHAAKEYILYRERQKQITFLKGMIFNLEHS